MDRDSIIQSTDKSALSCRLSCYLKGYIPQDEDPYIESVVSNIIKFQPLLSSKFVQMTMKKSLKKDFFMMFDENGRTNKTIINPAFGGNGGIGSLKSPVINRGTWIRYKSINYLISEFLHSYPDEQVQIVSIGSGSDTRCFQLLAQQEQQNKSNIRYFEMDFANSCKVKKFSILNSKVLYSAIGLTEEDVNSIPIPTTHEEFEVASADLHSPNYHLIPFDLRELYEAKEIPEVLKVIDPSRPTLLLCECVLCYLETIISDSVLKLFQSFIQQGTFVIYDPMGGEINGDNTIKGNNGKEDYGKVMANNLSQRGITMPSLFEYGTIEKEYKRFKEVLKFPNVWVSDLKFTSQKWGELVEEINQKIIRLEFLDELEEIDLINSYYCIALLKWGCDTGTKYEFQKTS